ncbi:hypothetical protein FBT96_06985 [Rhodobacter capsulatus]|uniref:DUF7742 domain-containing protein n=1 Tax=Rhodobacter capsulatus TaxID=1061 RepID=A0A4U1JT71_RHOCA|nr:hypothetical protein [Rhodobacter capsulatus]TKD22320.1 hypothetical protein FBT96_06985 [Rhodobacter capsulatus]
MRPILIDDLLIAARALTVVAAPERPARLAQWLREAHWADLYRKRLARAHPRWGNGSLMARALREPARRGLRPDRAEIDDLAEVIAAVRLWRARGLSSAGQRLYLREEACVRLTLSQGACHVQDPCEGRCHRSGVDADLRGGA